MNDFILTMMKYLDRKIEIPLPNETARVDILKIHALNVSKKGEIGKVEIEVEIDWNSVLSNIKIY